MADAFEEEAESTVSIQEYLKDIEEQELEADLVLGGDEGKECTYTRGYMKRQAIFSCLTCTPDGNAGVCTACSLSCHDSHEIVELWTKRNFRCDCGNSKFGEFFCKLSPNKDIENVENLYNHNFKGSYCMCGRPYPDPDVEEQTEMIQCCICEDWFHEDHLGLESSDEGGMPCSKKCGTVQGLLINAGKLIYPVLDKLFQIPRNEEGEPLYEDFFCQACSVVCSFLTRYPQTIWAVVRQHHATSTTKKKGVLEDMPSACGSSEKPENGICSVDSSFKLDCAETSANSEVVCTGKGTLVEHFEKDMGINQCIQGGSPSATCVLGVNLVVATPVLEKSKPMFLSKIWRDILCRCEKCADFYKQKKIGFLLDTEDSIVEYEKMAKQKRDEKLQQQEGVELNFLNKLGHVEKMEVLNGIADMKNEIHAFLETFDSSKPITSADVHQVFENLAKKRQRML